VLDHAGRHVTAIFQEHLISPKTATGAIWPFSRESWRPAHYHPQVELLLVTRGRMRERVGQVTHTAHAGHLVWHLPGIEHELVEASSDCEFVVVQVEPDVCADVHRSFGRVESGAGVTPAPFGDWIRDLGWMAAGRPVVEMKGADRDRVLEACAITCAADSLRPEQAATRVRAALEGAWRSTRDDHDDRRANSLVELACCLSLEDPSLDRAGMCRALDVSVGYLSRVFRRELGLAFVEQRARSRLVGFCTRVMRQEHSYLDAALLAGFGSYSQLHRVFVELVGVRPRDYFAHGGRNRRADRDLRNT
jgi:methylphosphotriester-DNA--protein-cysteine methyltransferase/quercetin dioxygenase-like cupin family protein